MPNLTNIQIKQIKELALELLDEILFSANKNHIQDQYVFILGLIASPQLDEAGIEQQLQQKQELFEEIAGLLKSLDENEAFNIADQLGKLTYLDQWKPKEIEKPLISNDNKQLNFIKLYKAKNGELCLRFQNKEKADEFLSKTHQGIISEGFRKGRQFDDNVNGLTPFQYPQNSYANQLFCPSYQAKNGEFAINLGSQYVAEKLINELKLKISNQRVLENGELQIIYADLFCCYRNPDGSDHPQAATIYFNEKNPIFTTPGTYIEINTSTGELKLGKVQDYDQKFNGRKDSPASAQQVSVLLQYNQEDNNSSQSNINIHGLFASPPPPPVNIQGITDSISTMVNNQYETPDCIKEVKLSNGSLIIDFTKIHVARHYFETYLVQNYSAASLKDNQIIFTNDKEIKEFLDFVDNVNTSLSNAHGM